MNRNMKRTSAAGLLGTALLALGGTAAAAPLYMADLSDPSGDAINWGYLAPSETPDIRRLRVVVEGGQVLFRMDFGAGTMDPVTLRMGFELDTDQDFGTGDTSRGLMGVDYYISHPLADGSVAELRKYVGSGWQFVGSVPVQVGSDWAQYSFDLAWLGDDGQMDFLGYSQTWLSNVSSSPFTDRVRGSTVAVQTVPEPGTLALGAAGALAGLGLRAVRPRRRWRG